VRHSKNPSIIEFRSLALRTTRPSWKKDVTNGKRLFNHITFLSYSTVWQYNALAASVSVAVSSPPLPSVISAVSSTIGSLGFDFPLNTLRVGSNGTTAAAFVEVCATCYHDYEKRSFEHIHPYLLHLLASLALLRSPTRPNEQHVNIEVNYGFHSRCSL